MSLIDLLRRPSAYRAEPWAYARNQLGHGYLVGGLPVLALGPWALLPVVAIYAVWEVVQWRRYGARISDGLEDTAHVLTVAVAAALHQPAILLIHLLWLAAGIALRRDERDGRSRDLP